MGKRKAQQEGKNKVNKSTKRKTKLRKEQSEEAELENLLFGVPHENSAATTTDTTSKETRKQKKFTKENGLLFQIDREGQEENKEVADNNNQEENSLVVVVEQKNVNNIESIAAAVPVWKDDDVVEVNLKEQSDRLLKLRHYKGEKKITNLEDRLRNQFQSTTMALARTDWAKLGNTTTTTTTSSAKSILAYQQSHYGLQMQRCLDINHIGKRNPASIINVEFHKYNDIVLTASRDRTLRIYRHDRVQQQDDQHRARKKSLLTSMSFPNLSITCAHFLGRSSTVAVTGRRSFFYLYDIYAGKVDYIPRVDGRNERSWRQFISSPHDDNTMALLGYDGYLVLWDVKTKRMTNNTSMKCNGSVRTACFDATTAHHIWASGSDGDMYRFDLRMMGQCVERFPNQDGTVTLSMACSSTNRLAVGAESGIVNLYDKYSSSTLMNSASSLEASFLQNEEPQRLPIATLGNLTTPVNCIKFNHDGQLMAFSSQETSHCGLKMAHVETGSVYANWPTSKTPLGRITCMDFSPDSQYFAMGNDNGKCLLYQIMEYDKK